MLAAIFKKLAFTVLALILVVGSLFGQNDDVILSLLKLKFNLTKYDQPTEIIRFNKDTILIVGYLEDVTSSKPRYEQHTNIVYKTIDGGITWRQIRFNGSAWIYDSFHDKKGNVWMGGSDNFVHYSPNFGDTWQRKQEPFTPINRVHAIFMVDSNFGVAGGLQNGLALTFNNWNTTKQIPTPLDQKKFRILEESSRNAIERVAIIDSIILIKQNDHIYFSKLNAIHWIEFKIPVEDFNVNRLDGTIVLQSRNGKHFVLSSHLDLIKTYKEDFIWYKVKDDSVFLRTDDFFISGVMSISIKATLWVFDRPGHMGGIFKPRYQKVNFTNKAGVYYYSRKYRDQVLSFSAKDLSNVFSSDQVNFSLSNVTPNLSFSDFDIKNYLSFLEEVGLKRKEAMEWGGDFTSQISLDCKLFQEYKPSMDEINPKYIESIYNHLSVPPNFEYDQGDRIEMFIVNRSNDTLKISNDNSYLYSLPWKIQFGRQSIKSYNPKITKFISSILPGDFLNYKMLLGGELIFELLQEQIIDELAYQKN